jgi:hypothetical protein
MADGLPEGVDLDAQIRHEDRMVETHRPYADQPELYNSELFRDYSVRALALRVLKIVARPNDEQVAKCNDAMAGCELPIRFEAMTRAAFAAILAMAKENSNGARVAKWRGRFHPYAGRSMNAPKPEAPGERLRLSDRAVAAFAANDDPSLCELAREIAAHRAFWARVEAGDENENLARAWFDSTPEAEELLGPYDGLEDCDREEYRSLAEDAVRAIVRLRAASEAQS